MEEKKSDYRNYSEIDYLLGSELADTPWGVDRFMQRLPLFDKPKQHIPYLMLLHLVFYNPDFPSDQKSKVIKQLLIHLHKDVIRGSKRNQLFDFFPPYYCLRLLLDIYLSGYNIKPLLKNMEIEQGSDPFGKLLEYGDCSVPGFPEALFFLMKELDPHWKKRDKFLLEIGTACLRAHNFTGFHHIYKNMKVDGLKKVALNHEIMAYVERNEIDKALKLIHSMRPAEHYAMMYFDMSFLLAKQGKIDIIREIRRNVALPEQVLGALCGMMAYHILNRDLLSARKILEEAFQVLNLIEDRFIHTLRLILVLDFAFQTGDIPIAEKSLEEAIFAIEHLLKKNESTLAQSFLLRKLISHKRLEQAAKLNIKWNTPANDQSDFWSEHNMNVELQVVAEYELNAVTVYRRHDDLFIGSVKKKAEEYYDTVFNVAGMIPGEDYRAESLFVIAKHIAKSGLYRLAIETKTDIPVDGYSDPFNTALPLYALTRGDLNEALEFTHLIKAENDKLAVLLCMSPHLEKNNQSILARQFIRDWAIHKFQNS